MGRARTLMLQGTASGVGKSLLAAAVCRLLARRGLRVLPFKAQNMALNCAVTADGGEVGRAQALQALACGVDVTRDMNPILLKPEADSRAQLVLLGEAVDSLSAAAYHRRKAELWPAVAASLDRLRSDADVVVIEGAGSPAEVNLRECDIVNMRIAEHAAAPVLLVGDIDRGGVFAALLGTLALLRPRERRLVAAMVVNNFRGDAALFAPGVAFLESRARLPVLGVVPHLEGLRLAQEDSLGLPSLHSDGGVSSPLDVAVVALPLLSNADDCDPLLREHGVGVRLVDHGDALGDPDLVVLPGSKTTRADLRALRGRRLDRALRRARARGTAMLGICGGFQLLGAALSDPEASDGDAPGRSRGLGLLPTSTRMSAVKVVRRVRGEVLPLPGMLRAARGAAVEGYEIHAGRTGVGPVPALRLTGWEVAAEAWEDGAVSDDGWVVGTNVHGLLDSPRLRRAALGAVAARRGRRWRPGPLAPGPDAELDRLADCVAGSLDVPRLLTIIEQGVAR